MRFTAHREVEAREVGFPREVAVEVLLLEDDHIDQFKDLGFKVDPQSKRVRPMRLLSSCRAASD